MATESTPTEAEANSRATYHAQLDDTADACLELHPGDIRGASKEMIKRVRSDPRLQNALFEVLVTEACTDRVRRRLQIKNQAIWHDGEIAAKPDYDPIRAARMRRAARTSIHFKLMEYSLIGGKPLALATKADLLKNAEFQSKQGTRMLQTASWLKLVAEHMPDDKDTIVRDVLKESDLRTYQDQVVRLWDRPAGAATA